MTETFNIKWEEGYVYIWGKKDQRYMKLTAQEAKALLGWLEGRDWED